jgi:hypothetical protein
MKETISISLRSQLVSASVEFLRQEEMQCLTTQDSLPDLISHLLYYKEEGKPLYPEIYIFDDLNLVKQVLPNSQFCTIGTGPKSKETILKALKKCAPLTEMDWAVYILRQERTIEYGVFRAGTSILSMSISEAIIESGAEELKAVLVHQISEKLIEVSGIKANPLLISYGAQTVASDSPTNSLLAFVNTIVSQVKESVREPAKNFFKKVLIQVLQRGWIFR